MGYSSEMSSISTPMWWSSWDGKEEEEGTDWGTLSWDGKMPPGREEKELRMQVSECIMVSGVLPVLE